MALCNWPLKSTTHSCTHTYVLYPIKSYCQLGITTILEALRTLLWLTWQCTQSCSSLFPLAAGVWHSGGINPSPAHSLLLPSCSAEHISGVPEGCCVPASPPKQNAGRNLSLIFNVSIGISCVCLPRDADVVMAQSPSLGREERKQTDVPLTKFSAMEKSIRNMPSYLGSWRQVKNLSHYIEKLKKMCLRLQHF